MTTPSDHAPRLVAGRYRLGTVLGRGAMGTVWSAQDELLGRRVAIKEVLMPLGIPDAEADVLRERSLREARAIAALSHPNVVTLYDVARQDGTPFVVMELVASDSLAELLCHGPVPLEQAVAIAAAVAAALQAAHAAGITHRDVKPGNVLVAHDGRIKLTDFGIARNLADQTMTATGITLGSPTYIAPEIASGGQVSPAADLWGLGATLFAAVEGRPPYDAGDPLATASLVVLGEVPQPTCSRPLATVISGLMRKDPARRMPLSQVRRLLGALPVTYQAPSSTSTASSRQAAPSGQAEPPPAPAALLAADPGPLPYSATHRSARAGVRWTLAALIFLGAAATGFAATRVASGVPALPDLGPGAPPRMTTTADGPSLVAHQLQVSDDDGTEPARCTVGVPQGWSELRELAAPGAGSSIVVRFVSPDGSELIAVQRATGVLSRGTPEGYLSVYSRQRRRAVTELVETRRERLADGGLEATLRTVEGPDATLRRTTYLRLVPAGADLWVLQVMVPTSRESTARTELFEPVMAGFTVDG